MSKITEFTCSEVVKLRAEWCLVTGCDMKKWQETVPRKNRSRMSANIICRHVQFNLKI